MLKLATIPPELLQSFYNPQAMQEAQMAAQLRSGWHHQGTMDAAMRFGLPQSPVVLQDGGVRRPAIPPRPPPPVAPRVQPLVNRAQTLNPNLINRRGK